MQVVKKGGVQLRNRLVPEGPVQQLARQIEDLQPDYERVLQVSPAVSHRHACCTLLVML